jgi:hypothetical protein
MIAWGKFGLEASTIDISINSSGQWKEHDQSFSRMELGKNLKYNCADLDPKLNYRWSAKFCFEKHFYLCQHKMQFVTPKRPETTTARDALTSNQIDQSRKEVSSTNLYITDLITLLRRQKTEKEKRQDFIK